MSVDLLQARPYLDALFGNAGAGEFILLYTLPNRASAWFTDVESVCAAIVEPKYQNTNIYVGMAMSPTDNGQWNRCKGDAISSLGCLWADVDVGVEGHHGKKIYAPTIEAAIDALSECAKPSIVVNTG